MARAAGHGRPFGKLAYSLAAFAVLAIAWNGFASRFAASEQGLRRNGDVFERAAANLPRTRAELPPPALPRVALLGSSQIAVVKATSADPVLGTPHQLRIALAERGDPTEVVDLSDGGQQAVESLLVYLATRPQLEARAVVIGVSLFSMLRLDVRPTLVAGLDVATLRDEVRAALPPDVQAARADALLAWSQTGEARVESRGKTLQERADEAIGAWLAARLPAFAQRQAMFDALVDGPLRRDLASWASRQLDGQRTARTYEIGSAFPVALLAIEVLARAARSEGVPLLVALLPYDDARPPVPFSAETQAEVLRAFTDAAAAERFTLLDLSHLLDSAHFGSFVDGSPDNLHYDPRGHTLVAQRMAEALVPLLAAPGGG